MKTWTVEINKGGKGARTLKVKHLVFATGFGGRPNVPDIPGKVKFSDSLPSLRLVDVLSQADFKGEAVHSSEFTSASNYTGKKAVIVGACTSGMSP